MFHFVELLLLADERRGELHDGVAAVIGAAVETGVEQSVRKEAAQDALGLGVGERLAGRLVLHQLDAEEEAVAADVADDRDALLDLLEPLAQVALVLADASEKVFV